VIYAHKIKYLKAIPGPLVAMLVATALQTIFKFDGVATLGSVFGHIPRGIPPFHMMELSLDSVTSLIGPAFTIALLGAIESLLSATAADGLAGGTKHRPNQELVGQGIANCISPLFGGFAATGAIARTATNIRNGGNSPLAAITHSVFLLVVILLLAPLAEYVPLCSLAAILFVVAYNMSDLRHFGYILKHSPRDGKIVLLVTFLLTVFADLVVAVNVGVILAMMLTMRRITTITTNVQQEVVDEDDVTHINNQFKRNVIVYAINGPLFFAITEKFAESLAHTHNMADAVVFKLKAVPFIDFSGLSAFQETLEKLHRQKITIYLYGVNPKIRAKFAEVGLLKLVETSSVFYSMLQIVKYDNSLSVNSNSDIVNKTK
jgi:SulP family sulfate permease